MDAGQVVTVVGFLVSIFAVLFGIAALMWQINNQSNRLEAKIDAQGRELRDEIREQGKYLEAKIDAQVTELRDEIREQGTRIEAQGARVSQADLDQARINGVNSVLLRHTHTHEAPGEAD